MAIDYTQDFLNNLKSYYGGRMPTLDPSGGGIQTGPNGEILRFNQNGEFIGAAGGRVGGGGGGLPGAAPAAPANPLAFIEQYIPGFGGLSKQGSDLISQLMSGGRTSAQDAALKQRQAQQSVVSGMPNTQNIGGTLLGNKALRDERDFAGAQQQLGFQDLLSMLGSYSGNVFPTANAGLQAQVQREGYKSEEAQNAARLAQANEEAEGRLGLGYAQLSGENSYRGGQLQQQADEFEKNFTLEEKKLAQSLGLSEKNLALELARLNAETSSRNRAQDLNEWNALGGAGGLAGLGSLFSSSGTPIPKKYRVPNVIMSSSRG